MTGPTVADVVRVERDGPLGIVTLNRPDRLNAIDARVRGALPAAIGALIDDPDIRAILLTGTGRVFCAGADLQEMVRTRATPVRPRGGDMLRETFNPLILRMIAAPKPIIAALNGPAVGVGCSLALAADVVLAARSAAFTLAFTRIGAVPDAGLTWLLPRLIGESRAVAAMLLGEEIGAEQAKTYGMVHAILDDDAFALAARAAALEIARGPTRAYAAIKALARGGMDKLSTHLAAEARWQDEAFDTSDFDKGVAAFLARESPDFHGN